MYRFIVRYVRWKSVASLITLFIIVTVIVGPVIYLSFLLAIEFKNLASSAEGGKTFVLQDVIELPWVRGILDSIASLFNMTYEDMVQKIREIITRLSQGVIVAITKGLGDVFSSILNFIFMVFAVFFLLMDGPYYAKEDT
ncbi:MAG: hypothetical protein WC539_09075 [Nitrospirota bacterium]